MSNNTGKAFDWKLFKRLFEKVRPYKTPFRVALLMVLVSAFLGPVRPELVQVALDKYVSVKDYNGLLMCTVLYVALLVIEALLQFGLAFFGNMVAQSVTLDLRSRLYQHVLAFRMRFFDKTPVGQLVTRHISDIDGIAEVFSSGFLSIFGDILKLSVLIVWMFADNWQLTLVVLIPIPILIYATRLFQRAVKKSFNDVRNEVARINVFIQEHVTGMNIVQIFNREKKEKEKFEQINKEHRNAHIRGIWAYSVFFPVVELLSAASISLLLWWSIGLTTGADIKSGELMKYTLYIFALYRPIRQMADNFNTLQMGVVNAERVFKLFDTTETQAGDGNVSAQNIKGEIHFENVWFTYDDPKLDKEPKWILEDINLKVKPGEMIAFVGSTGAGKTSIINLLNRFYDFQKGSLKIDGTNITDYSLESLRSHIGLVLQDVFLFSDTVLNNVTLGVPGISEEKVIEASRFVGTHDFISKLPGGYHYNVHERGSMLSSGQRQLLSFLRAFIHQPSILILDEATSSVDSESEELIRKATERITEGRTSFVIAHRLSTIQRADCIVVMEKGKIAEMGSHQQLLAMNGIYKRLYQLQFQES